MTYIHVDLNSEIHNNETLKIYMNKAMILVIALLM